MSVDAAAGRKLRVARRHRPIVFSAAALLLASCCAAVLVYNHYTDSRRVQQLVEEAIASLVPGARVDSATYTWNDGVRIHALTVADRVNGPAGHETSKRRPVFSCPEIHVHVSPWQLLRGRVDVRNVLFLGATLSVARDSQTGRTNLESFLRNAVAPPDAIASLRPPVIEFQNFRLLVADRDRTTERVVEDLTLNIRARPMRGDPAELDLVWETVGSQPAFGQSTLHLRALSLNNVQGGLPWMSLEAVLIGLNAGVEGAADWSGLLGLDGKVRAVDYRLGAASSGSEMRQAVIELSQASLSIPVNAHEQELDPSQRYLRFSNVDGTLTLRADRLEARFDARFRDGKVSVDATFRGVKPGLRSLDDVLLDATVSVTGFTLPRREASAPEAERRFISNWPRLHRFYEEYDPHGRADIHMEVEKTSGRVDQMAVRRLVAVARGGDAQQEDFPYRVRDLSGVIEYTREGLRLDHLCGRHGEGSVCVDGWVAGLARCFPVELQILGERISVDADLEAAVPGWLRRVRADYSPAGEIDLLIEVRRHACVNYQPAKWDWSAEVTFDDLSASYCELPYPLRQLSGSLVVTKDKVAIDDVRGFADESPFRLSGEVAPRGGKAAAVDARIEVLDLPIDEEFFCALGEPAAAALPHWNPRGKADFHSRVTSCDDESGLCDDTTVFLNGMSIEPELLPIVVHDAFGPVHVTDDTLHLDRITSRLGTGTIVVEGVVPRDPAGGVLDLSLRAEEITLDDSIRRALPEGARQTLADFTIDGRVSADVSLTADLGGPPAKFSHHTMLFLNGVDLRHSRLPLPLTDVRGVIKIDDNRADTQGLSARIGSAVGHARFQVSNHDGPGIDGSCEIREIRLDESLEKVLPSRVRKSWANLEPTGLAELNVRSLQVARSPQGRTTVFVAADIDLRDAALRGDFEAQGIRGHIAVEGWLLDSEGHTRLGGVMSVDRLTVAEREVGQVYAPWTFVAGASGDGRLAIGPAAGTMYEGNITANAEFTFLPDATTYVYSMMGHQIKLEQFHNASVSRGGASEPADVRGSVNAYLQVSGTTGDPSSRRGVGSVEIVDGFLYRLPLLVAILNVVNLKLPQEDHFDDAHAEFYVAGNKLLIDELRLESREISLVGSGTMSLPDYTVDLRLANLRPLRWANVPVLEDVVGGFSRTLVELQVTGPLSRPNVRALPLGALTDELKSLFQKRKPKRIQPLDP